MEAPLFNEPMIGYVGKDHRLYKAKEIEQSQLDLNDTWLLSEGHCLRGQVLNICGTRKSNEPKNLVFESGSLETLERLVEEHRGMTVIPYLATLGLNKKQQILLREFKEPTPVREVGFATNRVHIKTAMIQALRSTILKSIPSELQDIKGVPVPL